MNVFWGFLTLDMASNEVLNSLISPMVSLAENCPNYCLKKNSKKVRGMNENLAREILELHTMGVNGGYQLEDIQELAKAITGRSWQKPLPDGVSPDLAKKKAMVFYFVKEPISQDSAPFLGKNIRIPAKIREKPFFETLQYSLQRPDTFPGNWADT